MSSTDRGKKKRKECRVGENLLALEISNEKGFNVVLFRSGMFSRQKVLLQHHDPNIDFVLTMQQSSSFIPLSMSVDDSKYFAI